MGVFIDQSFQSRHDAVMKSTEWLSRQLDDIRKKMDDSSSALAQFQQSIGVTDLDSNKSTFTEHMAELSRQQTAAQSERIQLQAMLKNVGIPIPPRGAFQHGGTGPEPETGRGASNLSQAMVVYGGNHPTARKLQSEVDELQSQIDIQKKAIVNSLRASYGRPGPRKHDVAWR